MSTTSTTEQDVSQTVSCPHCGATVPDASFCGACGAKLNQTPFHKASRRSHNYAVFPDESMLRSSVVSSLFPQLTIRSRTTFRMAFSVLVVVLFSLALARLEPAVIAVSALGFPLLFICYVVEIDPIEWRFVLPAVGVILVSAALGVAFALVLGPTVSEALQPGLSPSLTNTTVLRSALLVPVIAQLLLIVPLVLLLPRRPHETEALDGFTVGAMSALGFTAAMTVTELASRVKYGNVMHGSVLGVLSSAVIRGLTLPLIAAATTGYVGAALWKRDGPRSEVRGRWLASPLFALAISLLFLIGLGFADDAGLSDALLALVYLAAAVLALAVLRVGLHHILPYEQRDVRIGESRLCPHCLHSVPAMPFCPNCGVAERATALHPLPLHRGLLKTGKDSQGLAESQREASSRAQARATSTDLTQGALFPSATAGQIRSIRGVGPRRLVFVLLAGLGVGVGVFVILAVLVPSSAPAPCVSLHCFTPFGPTPITKGTTYTSTEGWGVTWYPARSVFETSPPTTTARSTDYELRLEFSSSSNPAEDGELFFIGGPAQGQSSSQLVSALQQSNVPNATPDYVLPGATLGYEIGYGEAFETTPNSFEGDDFTYEVVITCAVVNGYAVCAYAVGPRVPVSQFVNHPTPSQLVLSLWSDPDLEGVFWKGHPVP